MGSLKENTFTYLIYLSYFLYIVSFLGVSYLAPTYHPLLLEIIKIYICILLIFNFNPFSKKKCSDFDKQLAFSAACFLFFTTVLGQIAIFYTRHFVSKVKDEVDYDIKKKQI